LKGQLFAKATSTPESRIALRARRGHKGGHDITDSKIRERYDRSRLNLIRLMPRLAALLAYDNGRGADLHAGAVPGPGLILYMVRGEVVDACDLAAAPEWTGPILTAALRGLDLGKPEKLVPTGEIITTASDFHCRLSGSQTPVT